MGWLGAKRDEKKVSPRFKKWVEQYMLPAAPRLTCTAEELYAARCAVLHTMTADSDLHRRKQLRRLFYAWGPSRPEDLQARIDQSRARGTGVVVHLQDLTEGLRLGAAQMFEDALNDDELRARIASKQGRFFAPYSLADFGGDRGGEQ